MKHPTPATATHTERTMPTDTYARLLARSGLRARLHVTSHRPLSTVAAAARSLTLATRLGR